MSVSKLSPFKAAPFPFGIRFISVSVYGVRGIFPNPPHELYSTLTRQGFDGFCFSLLSSLTFLPPPYFRSFDNSADR
jgi:hypothetical protein